MDPEQRRLTAGVCDAAPEACMGTVTSHGVDDLGDIFWVITPVESEDPDWYLIQKKKRAKWEDEVEA